MVGGGVGLGVGPLGTKSTMKLIQSLGAALLFQAIILAVEKTGPNRGANIHLLLFLYIPYNKAV